MRLRDKVIVVVGGTSGLGLSAAKGFLEEGAKVVVIGRNEHKLEAARKELGESALGLAADAIDPNAVRHCIARAAERFGGFHGLYHVAGGSGRRQGDGPLDQVTDAGWKYTLTENLDSVFYSNRAAAQWFMEKGTGGTVLNMGSVLALSPSPKHFATHAYAAAKAAIIGLTRSAAAFYAARQIRFNVLACALVATPMSHRAQHDPAISRFIRTKQPLDGGRIGVPADLDAAAVYFMSDESRFVTGQLFTVDGGWSVSEGQYQEEAGE